MSSPETGNDIEKKSSKRLAKEPTKSAKKTLAEFSDEILKSQEKTTALAEEIIKNFYGEDLLNSVKKKDDFFNKLLEICEKLRSYHGEMKVVKNPDFKRIYNNESFDGKDTVFSAVQGRAIVLDADGFQFISQELSELLGLKIATKDKLDREFPSKEEILNVMGHLGFSNVTVEKKIFIDGTESWEINGNSGGKMYNFRVSNNSQANIRELALRGVQPEMLEMYEKENHYRYRVLAVEKGDTAGPDIIRFNDFADAVKSFKIKVEARKERLRTLQGQLEDL